VRILNGLCFLLSLFLVPSSAHALSTAASFDLSWGLANITINSFNASNSSLLKSRTLSTQTVFQIDYNVAMFDYKTVATLSFTQVAKSNLGDLPLTRIGLGASYHFLRVNGQRVVLDNQVEGKIWGISPAIELTGGLTVLSVKDPADRNNDFTASMIDLAPKLLVEIPASSSFLITLRAGYLVKVVGGGIFNVKYSGSVFTIGVKLTTL
jgi:hypothetical protein